MDSMKTGQDDILTMPEPNVEGLFDLIDSSMDGMRRMYVLREALRLRMFDRLQTSMSSQDLAMEMGLEEGMIGLFCEALRAMNPLDADEEGRYCNSVLSTNYLVSSSPYTQDRSLRRTWVDMERWGDLEHYLQNGPEVIDRSSFFNEDWIHGMAERSRCGTVQKVVNDLVNMVSMEGGKLLLDLGGGHGLYAIAFCARIPDLQAVVMDLPEVVPLTRHYIERYGATAVKVQAGDFIRDDLGRDYDLVFSYFNSSGSDLSMAPKVAAAVRPGGHLLMRQFSEQAKTEPLAVMEWNFVTVTGMRRGRRRFSGPNSCSLREYGKALEGLGFEIIRHWSYDRVSEMMVARKGGE